MHSVFAGAVLLNQTESGKSKRTLWATIASTALWLVSIIAAFQIKPENPLIWLPDALLLLGFFPLLILWRQGWLTFLFGLSNAFIGLFLLVLKYLESDKFTGQMLSMKEHLVDYHNPWSWLLVGLVAFIWGAIQISISLGRLILKGLRKNNSM
jgi:hypothetical protein